MKTHFLIMFLICIMPLSVLSQVKVYSRNSNYSSALEFTISGPVTLEEFVAIWYAVKYSW